MRHAHLAAAATSPGTAEACDLLPACGATRLADLGQEVAPGLCAAELDYLRREEWACTGEDAL